MKKGYGYISQDALLRTISRLEELLRKAPAEFRDDLQLVINMLLRNPADNGVITIYLDQDYRW